MILSFTMPLKSFCLLLVLSHCLLFNNSFADGPQQDTITIGSSGTISLPGRRNHPLNTIRNVPAASLSQRKKSINQILDSLGYLERQWLQKSGEQLLYLIPGSRYQIAVITIDTEIFSDIDFTLPSLPIAFDAGDVNRMISHITRTMAQNGYPFARVITSIEKSEDLSVAILFTIDPERLTAFSHPLLSGDIKREELFFPDISFETGELFDINKVDQTVTRLRSRPYVSSVELLPPVLVRGEDNVNDSILLAVVPLAIEERSGMSLQGTLGFRSGDSRSGINGMFDISLINMFNRGEQAQLHYYGDNRWQRLFADVRVPWLLGSSLAGGVQLGIEIEEAGYGHTWGSLSLDSEISAKVVLGTVMNISETVPADTAGPWTFYGGELILRSVPQSYQKGVSAKEFLIKTGSGFARRERVYSRTRMELSGGIHTPFLTRHAAVCRLFSKNLFTDEQDLAPAELFRVGGHKSIRGYAENEFVFRSVLYGQAEYLLYLNNSAPVYIFIDAGSGFIKSGTFGSDDRVDFVGYGLGLRFPSRIGTASVEWARNISDSRSGGRVHIGVKNRF